MQVTVSLCHMLSGFTIFEMVLASTFRNPILKTSEETVKKLNLKCNIHCPYGFEADIEGFYVCRCYDPCSTVFCLRGSECVAEMPSDCSRWPCRARAVCKDVKKTTKDPNNNKVDVDNFLNIPQKDDSQKDDDVCSLPLSEDATSCVKRRRRWYYSPMTGKCVRFMGCDTQGNNFSKKIDCKQVCRARRIHLRRNKNGLKRRSSR